MATILAFDLETAKLASEVEVDHAVELQGSSPWTRPDLFRFACGVAVDIESGEAAHYGPGGATDMLEALRGADVTVGYNSSQFDIGVLEAYGDVEVLCERHVDLCAEVREALEALRMAQPPGVDRLRQGGLNSLAKANGLSGKSGDGQSAVSLYRAGRIEELLGYCESDTRLSADLYRIARERGGLQVDPYYRDAERERIYLPRTTLPLAL